jgi:hypothetical protein
MSVASVAQLLLEQSSGGGGGGVDNITAGAGITVDEVFTGTFEITNDGVLGITAGAGITVDEVSTGNFEITSDVNPSDYYTIADADSTFQTLADMADYSTTTQADALYQPIADMANYSTTTEANALYQPIGNEFLTQAVADTLYYPINKIYYHLGLADLTTMAPQSAKGIQINVPFYSRVTSAVLISANDGATVESVVCNAYWVSSTEGPDNTVLEISFYNSSTTYTVNSGMNYTILIINNF